MYNLLFNNSKKVVPLNESSSSMDVVPFVKPIDKHLERLRDPFVKYV
tara:strand:+ start:120 stop:260 length:141 start_codon:yes stop_codon:yes gene_type:complete